jgi:hypothetical protein
MMAKDWVEQKRLIKVEIMAIEFTSLLFFLVLRAKSKTILNKHSLT